MTFDPVLDKAQTDAVQYMLRPESDGAALLAWEVGLGKTRTGTLFARAQGARCVLAVVPLTTAEDWYREVQAEYPEVEPKFIDSTAQGKKNLAAFQWRQAGFYIVGHEYWERLAWVKKPVPKRRTTEAQRYRKVDSGCWSGDGFTLIFDEVHRAANMDSWTHKALRNIDPDVFILGMSGTFMGDRFEGAYGVTKCLWPHRTDIIPNKVKDWRKLWAEVAYDHFAPDKEKTVGEKEEGAFVSSLPCYLRMESDEPPAIPLEVWVDLYPEQRRVYDELDDKMVAWIEEDPLVTEYAITKRSRQRTVTLGFPTLTFSEDGETLLDVDFSDDAESAKIDALFKEIDGKGTLRKLMVNERLLILTDSRKFARLLTLRLNQKYGDVAREWSGKIKRADRKIAKQGFIDGTVRFIVGVQAAMGTGTNGLQTASHIVVFMSRADRRINNEQGVGRLRRKGQEKQVYVVSFLARSTIDTGQFSAQVEAALKMARSLKAKIMKEKRESLFM